MIVQVGTNGALSQNSGNVFWKQWLVELPIGPAMFDLRGIEKRRTKSEFKIFFVTKRITKLLK